MPTKITDLSHLKKLCDNENNEPVDCFINLGGIRSSKSIMFCNKTWSVFNEIDDTEDMFDDEDLLKSNTGRALLNGNLYMH